jgi:hypothetical protein
MASDVERPSAAMEAGGFYNKYSLIPSGGVGASRRSFQGISLFSAAPARFARHGNGREPRIGRHPFSQSARIATRRLFGCLGSRR